MGEAASAVILAPLAISLIYKRVTSVFCRANFVIVGLREEKVGGVKQGIIPLLRHPTLFSTFSCIFYRTL